MYIQYCCCPHSSIIIGLIFLQEVFFGITTNSLLLQRDDVPQCSLKAYKVLAKKVSACGMFKGQLPKHLTPVQ